MTRITIDFILLTILGMLVVFALEWAFGASSSSIGIVVSMVAAMATGQVYAKRHRVLPEKGFCWKVAVWLTALTTVLSGLLLFAGGVIGELVAALGVSMTAFVTLGAALLSVVVIRFAFRYGAKLTMRQIDAETGKTFE